MESGGGERGLQNGLKWCVVWGHLYSDLLWQWNAWLGQRETKGGHNGKFWGGETQGPPPTNIFSCRFCYSSPRFISLISFFFFLLCTLRSTKIYYPYRLLWHLPPNPYRRQSSSRPEATSAPMNRARHHFPHPHSTPPLIVRHLSTCCAAPHFGRLPPPPNHPTPAPNRFSSRENLTCPYIIGPQNVYDPYGMAWHAMVITPLRPCNPPSKKRPQRAFNSFGAAFSRNALFIFNHRTNTNRPWLTPQINMGTYTGGKNMAHHLFNDMCKQLAH